MKKSIKPELTTKNPKEKVINDDVSDMFRKATIGSDKSVKKIGFGSQKSLKKTGFKPANGSDGSESAKSEKALTDNGKPGG